MKKTPGPRASRDRRYAHASRAAPLAVPIAGELLDQMLERTGIDKREIDGVALAPSYKEINNAFWSNFLVDYLGLRVTWLQTSDLGGGIPLALVDRASAAIRAGHCEVVLLLGADVQREPAEEGLQHSGYRAEWERVQGLPGAPGEFGLLLNRYRHEYELDERALAKIAVVQRAGAVNHEYACDQFRKPITEADYFASRMIADPLRLLDCVMPCDGGAALLLMSTERAKRAGSSNASLRPACRGDERQRA